MRLQFLAGKLGRVYPSYLPGKADAVAGRSAGRAEESINKLSTRYRSGPLARDLSLCSLLSASRPLNESSQSFDTGRSITGAR